MTTRGCGSWAKPGLFAEHTRTLLPADLMLVPHDFQLPRHDVETGGQLGDRRSPGRELASSFPAAMSRAPSLSWRRAISLRASMPDPRREQVRR